MRPDKKILRELLSTEGKENLQALYNKAYDVKISGGGKKDGRNLTCRPIVAYGVWRNNGTPSDTLLWNHSLQCSLQNRR